MSNVTSLPGICAIGAGPNIALVDMLRDMLERAESGQLQSFVGTGFGADGLRMAAWCDTHDNVYEMAGTLAWLQAEYMHRHTS